MTEQEMINWIDNASYEQLLSRWRNAPLGDQIFRGDVGAYFKKKIDSKKLEVGNNEHVRASKSIGWTPIR